ncbi:MAG: hypothetical protein BWY20_02250 [Spirochaetes bacterium ADurb.Bin215]|nr:MAG: hypothetical protein BWY20_02250 [Spirochaetes bacterium ADurb.Bin215]
MNARFENVGIPERKITGRSTVNKHRIERLFAPDKREHAVHGRRRVGRSKQVFPGGKVERTAVKAHDPGIGDTANPERYIRLFQFFLLQTHLLQELSAHHADSEQKEFDGLHGVEEKSVRDTYRLVSFVLCHYGTDRAFGRALCNCVNIDAAEGKRGKEFTGNAFGTDHAVAYNRNNGHAR